MPDGAAAVVLEKGTLDALHGGPDKLAVLHECARILAPTGVIVSVSFPAVARIQLLEHAARKLGLQSRMRVVAKGDPADGHQAVFVAVLGKELDAVAEVKDALTEMLLDRMRRTVGRCRLNQ